MTLERLRRHWDLLGKKDPLWAVLALENKRGNRWRVDEFFATGQDEIEEVTKHMGALGVELDRRNALDFGCGVGRLTQALADRFEVVWGVDIAPSMIEQATRFDRHPGTCHYILNERADLRMEGVRPGTDSWGCPRVPAPERPDRARERTVEKSKASHQVRRTGPDPQRLREDPLGKTSPHQDVGDAER